MRIGFDVSQTGKHKAGCGYLADSLIRSLATADRDNQYLYYPTFGDFYFDPEWAHSTVKIKQANFKRGLAHRTLDAARQFWNANSETQETALGKPDIIHANNFYCPTGLKQTRLVYTLYDLSFLSHPEWTTETNRLGCFNGVFNASLNADWIVAISEFSRNHFLQIFPHYPAERVSIIPLGNRFPAEPIAARPAVAQKLAPDQFWLNVGTIEPRKNQRRLLAAYADMVRQNAEALPLVLAGGAGWLMDDFEATIDELQLRERVILTGYVSDESLHWLYQNCFALVYPSLFEGFGLPVLEAMSQGKAVISSTTTSIPEIVNDAGLLVDPADQSAIANAMYRLSENSALRTELGQKARQRAQSFTWKAATQKLLAVYQAALRLPKYRIK